MALEDLTGTKYIDALVSSNPASGDTRTEGDDHLRGIKNVLLLSLPNITGAITATQAELNTIDGYTGTTADLNIISGGDAAGVSATEFQYLNGVTSALQTQIDGKAATAHNQSASTITSGTLVVARGGSGRGSATAHGVLIGGTTSTGAHRSVAVGTSGQVLTSNGAAAPTMETPSVASSSVGQAELKTTTQETTAFSGSAGNGSTRVTFNGGTYSLGHEERVSINYNIGDGDLAFNSIFTTTMDQTTDSTSYVSTIGINYTRSSGTTNITMYTRYRYVTATPPHDLGDGITGSFVFLLVNKVTGIIEQISASEDPPWIMHGPTNVQPAGYEKNGQPYKYETVMPNGSPTLEMGKAGMMTEYIAARRSAQRRKVQITSTMKNSDMGVVPHPFIGYDPTKNEVVLLDPMSDFSYMATDLQNDEETVPFLFSNDYIRLDETPITRNGPSVKMLGAKWRVT